MQRPRRPVPSMEGTLAVETSISFQVSVLAKLLDRRLARLVVDRSGLTVAEYRVLAQVMLYPRSTVRAIAERTYVDKAQVSRAAAALEASSYVTRHLLDHDRRSPVFNITRTGRTLLNRIIPVREAQEREFVAGLATSDLQTLQTVLSTLIEALGGPETASAGPDADKRSSAGLDAASAEKRSSAGRKQARASAPPRRHRVPAPRQH